MKDALKNIDRKKIAAKATDYGRMGFRLALKAAAVYAGLVLFGIAGGGYGVYWVADYFGHGGWLGSIGAFIGTVAGAIGGFWLAHIVVMGLAQDMLLDAGIEAGRTGLRSAMKMLKEKRAPDTAAPEPPGPPAEA